MCASPLVPLPPPPLQVMKDTCPIPGFVVCLTPGATSPPSPGHQEHLPIPGFPHLDAPSLPPPGH